ncbi:MAG: SDR family oxidoreductase [Sphingorhabdus sp.]
MGVEGGAVAIVTGGSRGIGRQVAEQLLADGWNVCITGRKQDSLDAAVAEMDAGERLLAVAGRAQDAQHQQDVVSRLMERWGRIDGLVNNAATSPYLGDLVDASAEQIERGFATNFIAPWSWIKHVYDAHMREHGGSIVNVASIGGTYPVPRVGVYNVTKAAVIHMTKQMGLEMAPKVRINAVAPATIKTDFAKAKYEGREQEVADQYPLQRLGTPEEVAEAVVMLLEGKLGWMTGQTLILDGGASLIQGVR